MRRSKRQIWENKKIKKESGMAIKSYAVFCSLVLILATISFSINLAPTVKAQQPGCCEKTTTSYANPPLYCEDDISLDNCEGLLQQLHSFKPCSEIENCKLGVCVCPSGCSEGISYAKCYDTPGCYWINAADTEDVEVCQEGCCSIPKDLVCELKQKRVCENEAGGPDYGFDASIKLPHQCSNMCGLQEKGTCKIAAGNCVFTTKEGCINNLQENNLQEGINFFSDTYVSQVVACGVSPHHHLCCGKYGDEEKICFCDNQGNVEECSDNWNCGGDEYTCKICNPLKNETCYDKMRDMEVNKNDPYCKYTTCEISLLYGGQRWDEKDKRIVNLNNNQKKAILNTRSICYNFYTAYGDPDMLGISTGLQNSKIICQEGTATSHPQGDDRGQLCVQGGVSSELVCTCNEETKNEHEKCRECGVSGSAGYIEWAGDLFGIAYFDFLNDLISEKCRKGKCEGLGDCIFHEDVAASYNGGVGSCDPKYPPGKNTLCGECGAGGDSNWNTCTKAECYSLGNCKFDSKGLGIKALSTAQLYWPLVYYAERVGWIGVDCGIELAAAGVCLIPGASFICDFWCGTEGGTGISRCLTCLPRRIRDKVWGMPYDQLKTIIAQAKDAATGVYDTLKGEQNAIAEGIKKGENLPSEGETAGLDVEGYWVWEWMDKISDATLIGKGINFLGMFSK